MEINMKDFDLSGFANLLNHFRNEITISLGEVDGDNAAAIIGKIGKAMRSGDGGKKFEMIMMLNSIFEPSSKRMNLLRTNLLSRDPKLYLLLLRNGLHDHSKDGYTFWRGKRLTLRKI